MIKFEPFRMEARAFIQKANNGKPLMLYQEDQYFSSFLCRVYSFQMATHSSYTNEVLMWWTGLFDKLDFKIFDGDYISITGDDKPESDGSGYGLVYWDKKKLSWAWKYSLPVCPWNPDIKAWAFKGKIIGNIFENPELLIQSNHD